MATVYDPFESTTVVAYSQERLFTSHTGPLFEITRTSDSAVLDCYSKSQAQDFLNGTPGRFSKSYDQKSGAASGPAGAAFPMVQTFGGRLGMSGKTNQLNMALTNFGMLSGVAGMAAVVCYGNMPQSISNDKNLVLVSTGSSSTNSRLLLRIKDNAKTLEYASRKTDGTSATITDAVTGIVDHVSALVTCQFAGRPMSVYQDGVLDAASATYFTAGGTCSATTPLAGYFQWPRSALFCEGVIFSQDLQTGSDKDALLAYLATYFADEKLIGDGAYTGANHPLMIVRNGRTLIGSVTRQGQQRAVEIDNTTKEVVAIQQIGANYGSDDHGPATVSITPGGKFFTTWAGHGVEAKVFYGRGATDRINSISAVASLTVSTTCAYSQFFAAGTNVYIMTRAGDEWVIFKSMDDGVIWGSELHLVTNPAQFYVVAVPISATVVRFFGYLNSSSASNSIKVAEWDTVTGMVTSPGLIGNTTTLPLTASLFSAWQAIVTPSQTHISAYGYNLAGTQIVYAQHTSLNANGEYFFAELTGADQYTAAHWTKTKIVDSGAPIGTFEFIGRADISKESGLSNLRVYLARNTGTNSAIEKYDRIAGVWTYVETISSLAYAGEQKNFRPYCAQGSAGEIPVMWMRDYYLEYNDYDTSIRYLAEPQAVGGGASMAAALLFFMR